ncbi:MAG: hypothetical protein JO069_02745, partial [Verrucomicrobia bacterium]|nr:hypothetical protein [Verrucomicrobiota bacterium]
MIKLIFRKCPAPSLVSGWMGLYLTLPDRGVAQGDVSAGVQSGTLGGTDAFGATGYLVDASGNLIPFAAAGREILFGDGATRGVTSSAINGQAVQRRVTPTVADANGMVTHFHDLPTPDGNAFTLIETDPGVTASGFKTRGALER